MDYKKAFYSKLEDCYLGAKVKQAQSSGTDINAKSGFTNLLDIKAQYFAHIKAHLELRVREMVGDDSIESNDIYNKLYTFFDSYLNETGTPFFTDTPIYKNIYAKIYSNSKDTSLFYKTQNLYYVKSDTLYQSLILQDSAGKFSIHFDASEYKQNADNNKSKVIFKLDSIAPVVSERSERDNPQDENPTHPLAPSAREGENEIPQIIVKVTNQKDLFPELSAVFKVNSNEFSDEFIKALCENDLLPKKLNDSHLESIKKLFSSYKKQNEIDFFIHKDAGGFLKEQFDLWMFSYLYKDSAFQQWSEFAITRLQRIKNLAYEIIEFIARFEDELKAIWLKPKFAKNTQYVFSIETILANATNAPTLLTSIFSDTNFKAQITEWKELNLVDEDFDISSLRGSVSEANIALQSTKSNICHTERSEVSQKSNNRDSSLSAKAQNDKNIDCHESATFDKVADSRNDKDSPSLSTRADKGGGLNKYKFLPIDTKHLSKETKFTLLCAFDDLEALLNGELIKSDNFQALNSIMPKYQGKIDLIYIDPPYNTGNDDFIYADKFNHASWLSMIGNRLELSKNILNDKGSIFVSIDDNEQANLKLLMDSIFGNENFVANFIWQGKYTTSNDAKYASTQHENIFSYAKNLNLFNLNLLNRTESMNAAYKNIDNDPKGSWKATPLHAKSGSKNNLYEILFPNGISWSAPKGRYPRYSKERLMQIYEENGLYFNKNGGVDKKTYLQEVKQGKTIGTFWSYKEVGSTHEANEELASILDKGVFDNPKPEQLINRIAEIASKKDSIILDFFAGSGTTCAVVLKLGRKFVGIEMGEHFYKVVLPRLKKVIAGFASGISKEVEYKGGGAFRYYELESYEEALANCEYVLNSPSLAEGDIGGGYPIIDYRKSRKLIKQLNKENDKPITLNMSGYRAEFDIFQSIANLMGWKIKRLFLDKSTHPLAPSAREGGQKEETSANATKNLTKQANNGESVGIESCEYHNGEILNLESIDIAKYPKLKNLIWWETNA